MTFYVYAYYYIPKKDLDIILFFMKKFFKLFYLKKDEIKILFSYEVISINIKSHARFGMAFYVYAYYFITKEYFDLIFFQMKELVKLFHLKKDEIKIIISYEVISIYIKS